MTAPDRTAILIPAYEPDDRLVHLVRDLVAAQAGPVVVVDDGSPEAYAGRFAAVAAAGAEVLTHPVNRGKGAALKTGFAHVLATAPGTSVVCADSDGQHSVVDILRVADRLDEGAADLVLGGRRFTGAVPRRSRWGNALTRHAFSLATGQSVFDTQTGLRGHPSARLPELLDIPGERFEYELRVLLAASRAGQRIEEIEIATIYLDENASSHFRPVRDSIAVWGQLLAFTASSLLAFALDVLALALLYSLTGSLLWSVIGARLVSASANFTINRRFVFGGAGVVPLRTALPRYAALAAAVLLANALLMEGLVVLTGSLALAKVLTESTLFVASYLMQRTAVFAARGRSAAPGAQGIEVGVAQATSVTSPPRR
ncbi:MAG: bifunctional glycosyltransferase family 2/GtrA family protein [Actinobacteria bacterium]|nr:bifunctional glycosyltransferase family 2/GtrA family protein [Actinomycetota bacterium]